jgi:hypothetical protein
MTRRKLTIFLAGAGALLAVACSDSLVAPVASEKTPDASQPVLRRSLARPNSLSGSFMLTPQGGDYRLGDFTLHVPAGALCDPSSTYGPEHWNEACVLARRPIRLNVELTKTRDRLWVDFTPNLRFAPGDDQSGWVTISTQRPVNQLRDAVERGRIRAFALLYAHGIGQEPVDEASTDRTLITHVDLRDGTVWRRIKHFSGYTISAGDKCETTANTTCGVLVGEVDIITSAGTTTAP